MNKDNAPRLSSRFGAHVGLCDSCRHARPIESDRGSVFFLCELSANDPRFPKYPALPVIRCPGYTSTS
jgi:hypothetical protein